MNFLVGATSPDSFFKAYTASETKRFFPYEWFNHPYEMQYTELPSYDAFYSNLRSCNPLEAEYTEHVNLVGNAMTAESKLLSNWSYQCVCLQELRNIDTCKKYESSNTWAVSKNFCVGITTKTFPLWRQCKSLLLFTITKTWTDESLVVR